MSDQGRHFHVRSADRFESNIEAERDLMQSEGHDREELIEVQTVLEDGRVLEDLGGNPEDPTVEKWRFYFDTTSGDDPYQDDPKKTCERCGDEYEPGQGCQNHEKPFRTGTCDNCGDPVYKSSNDKDAQACGSECMKELLDAGEVQTGAQGQPEPDDPDNKEPQQSQPPEGGKKPTMRTNSTLSERVIFCVKTGVEYYQNVCELRNY